MIIMARILNQTTELKKATIARHVNENLINIYFQRTKRTMLAIINRNKKQCIRFMQRNEFIFIAVVYF